MVRTKADRVPAKAVGSKAPAKVAASTTIKKSVTGKGRSYAGGNPYHPRDTPNWQKPITSFMNKSSTEETATGSSSASASVSKNNEHEKMETSTEEEDDED